MLISICCDVRLQSRIVTDDLSCYISRESYTTRIVSDIAIFVLKRDVKLQLTRREMYCGHPQLCVCLSVCLSVFLSVCLSAAARPLYCTDPDVTWG